MTQLTVSIESPDMLRDVKKAISMIRGVISVKSIKTKSKSNSTTVAAIEEARSGKTIHCGSFENYKRMMANLDDV
ncbi:MAG: hypothetical protein NC301_06855 [Bacteroides sp.]|nr:hypothetical protein [Bacteroides sp.]MCM1378906.1 hypothetical protein [Bacteroides sp.]MCM1445522.1 hypothetical protein [Prevotella sp.]